MLLPFLPSPLPEAELLSFSVINNYAPYLHKKLQKLHVYGSLFFKTFKLKILFVHLGAGKWEKKHILETELKTKN